MTETITVDEITTVPAKKRNWKKIALIATAALIGGAVVTAAVVAANSSDDCEDGDDSDTSVED